VKKYQLLTGSRKTPHKLKNATIAGHFGFVLGKLGQQNHIIILVKFLLRCFHLHVHQNKKVVFSNFAGVMIVSSAAVIGAVTQRL